MFNSHWIRIQTLASSDWPFNLPGTQLSKGAKCCCSLESIRERENNNKITQEREDGHTDTEEVVMMVGQRMNRNQSSC